MKVYEIQSHFLKSKGIHDIGKSSLHVNTGKSGWQFSSRIVRLNYMIDVLILFNALVWPSLLLVEFMIFYSR